MADFDLTQTDQQVQNILNDAQGAMGASAQTTLTTEYVMLKDTSGIYHKILKSSFTEAIRDVLAGLLVNNDKGTTINQIAAIASGDFGSVTPANLASVLGASTTTMQASNTLYRIYKFEENESQTIIISYRDGIWLFRTPGGNEIHCHVIRPTGNTGYSPTFFVDANNSIYMKHNGFFRVYPLTPHKILSEVSSVPESSLTQLTIE